MGVDSETRLVQSVSATAVNVADSKVFIELLHNGETAVWGGQAC